MVCGCTHVRGKESPGDMARLYLPLFFILPDSSADLRVIYFGSSWWRLPHNWRRLELATRNRWQSSGGPGGSETTATPMTGRSDPRFSFRVKRDFKAPCTSLPGSSSAAAHSFTSVRLLHREGNPVAAVSWNKGHLNSFYLFGWGILSLVVGESYSCYIGLCSSKFLYKII